ncbi:hypothetical protein [Rhodanobacter umsongensis]
MRKLVAIAPLGLLSTPLMAAGCSTTVEAGDIAHTRLIGGGESDTATINVAR